ncbi:Ger(x)C family spore germination protein [Clostridium hydrogenum]|uniref:Ger(x)C family spore germination protein n=1 Tax=Clostridium hydrogenum TaxID=2855764 RepID=UPI001F3451FE|nr:Ger(x)C family spore germination protein [Clostridium hydrogenum]
MKRLISIFIIIVLMIASTGCKQSKQEINQMGIVLTTGFDLTPDGKYIFTAELLNPESSSSSTSKKNTTESSSDVVIFTSLGDTPYTATTNLAESYGKPLFFAHSKYVVLGENLSKQGLNLFMDAVFRIRTTRPDTILLIAKGRASDIVKANAAGEKIPADSIENLVKFQSSMGYFPMISRLDFANALLNKTSTPILGVITLKNKFNTDNTFDLSGTAIFKNDKLIGFMDMNETRGMEWIEGKVQSGIVSAHMPDNSIVDFSILHSKSKIKPLIKKDSLSIQININAEANIVEMTSTLNPMKDYKVMDKFSTALSNSIKSEVLLALNSAQKKYKSDVFGFGNIISQTYPDLWDKIKPEWQSIFPNIKVDVTVTSSVKRPGLISKPIK